MGESLIPARPVATAAECGTMGETHGGTHNDPPTCQNLPASAVRHLRRSADYLHFSVPVSVGRKHQFFQRGGRLFYYLRTARMDSVAHLFRLGHRIFGSVAQRARGKNLSDSVLCERRHQRTLGLARTGVCAGLRQCVYVLGKSPPDYNGETAEDTQ